MEFRKFLAITLKWTVNTFHKKKKSTMSQSTHKLPISPFSKYHKNRTISPFSPIFLRNSKNPNHRQVDLTLAHKMNIRFTKISQSPSRPSVKHYLISIFYVYFSEFRKFLAFTLKVTVPSKKRQLRAYPETTLWVSSS